MKFSKILSALHVNVNVNMGSFQIVNKEKIEKKILYKFSIFDVQFWVK